MANLEEAIIARIKKGNVNFEILVNCEKALEYRAGKITDLNEVVASKGIFSDVRKANKATNEEIKKAFLTEDENSIIDQILKKGDIQLTAEHKAKLRENKRKQIIAFIHTNAVDAKTGYPFPPQRIEMLMEEAKVKIDEFETLEHEIQNVIKALRPLIPIKLETRELEIDVAASFASQVLNLLKRKTKIVKEDWKSNGNLVAIFEIPAGIQEEIENDLNKLTKGDVDIKILNKK
ncbi:ribosome assembly factor SBDS [Candidatus Woesearchaeota archaeon]|nr:ribosome assembly factor SBDS [Candidatus Woesearchaeota archaeon]